MVERVRNILEDIKKIRFVMARECTAATFLPRESEEEKSKADHDT
jgi:hypothetical protein